MSIQISSVNQLIGTFSSHFTLYEGWNTSSSLSPFLVGFVEIVTLDLYSFQIVFLMIGLFEISRAKNLHEFTNTLSLLLNFVSGLMNF